MNAAMMYAAPGPTTRSSALGGAVPPAAARSRGLNASSIACTASRSACEATRWKRSAGGKTLGMMRTALFQLIRRTGIGRSADGASDTTFASRRGGRSDKVSAPLGVEIGADEKESGDAAGHQLQRRASLEERRVVRPVDPGCRRCGGEKDLETLVDPENV